MSTSRARTADAGTSIPPPHAAETQRTSIDSILSRPSRPPLTIVTAGAGWGKTTAIAGWARRAAGRGLGPVAWLTLTPAHDSPVRFWDSLHHALGARTEPVLLVLDNFEVITDQRITTELAELASRPAGARFLILTQCTAQMPLHRLRLAGVLEEVTSRDLAFDADAVRDLAARAECLDLTHDDVDEILRRTEGWPAGVRLAIRHMARGVGEGAALTGFGGADASVAEYFEAEVLRRCSPQMREFLLRTSVVDVLSADLAAAIYPGCDGLAWLEALRRQHGFVVRANPEGTEYRYHPLLQDVLLHALTRDHPAALLEAHRASAAWYLANRQPVSALGHAVSAQDWTLATDAFIDASPFVLGHQRSIIVEQLQAIPFDSLEFSAALALCAAGLELCRGRLFAMEARIADARRLIAKGDTLRPVAMAFLENLAGQAARASGDESSVADAARAALTWVSRAAPGESADGNRLFAMIQSAVALLQAGDVAAARVRLTTVVRDASRGELEFLRLDARAHLAWCDLADGDLEAAVLHASELADDASLEGWTSLSPMRLAYVTLAMSTMLRGELDAADRWVSAAVDADARGFERWSTILMHLARASIAASLERPRTATRAMDASRRTMQDRRLPPALDGIRERAFADVTMLTETGNASTFFAETEQATPTRWATRARIALAHGDTEGARRAASRVPRTPESSALADLLAAIEALTCEALIAARQHRLASSAEALGAALELAFPQRISRPFVIMGADELAPILRDMPLPAHQQAFRSSLLGMLGANDEVPAGHVELEPLLEPLTERELEVLVQLPTMRTNEEIARDFYVSVNTVKSHLQHLYRKFGVTNRREAVRQARLLGLLP